MRIMTRDVGREHFRELWIDGEEKAICRLIVIDLPMRIGTTVVRMAGIGDVYTQREHRKKGYMRHLYEDTVRYMTDEGSDVSMLFGIENFYTKFGYASSLASYVCKVKTRDAEVAGAQAGEDVFRPIEEKDMSAVLALYNANNAARTGTIVRTPEDFPKFHKGTWYGAPPEATLLEDANGALLAYVVWDANAKAVKVAEVEAWDDALFPALLASLAEQAVTKRCEDIELHLPLDHPFGEFVQRHGAKWKLTYPRYGSGMMRVLNQQSFFEKIAPELERRLAVSPLAGYAGTLVLCTDLGTTSLTFNAGKLVVGTEDAAIRLELSQDRLVQLVMGYRSVRDVLNDPRVKVHGDVVPLLNTLFPRSHPYVWVADQF
jgi:predicted acetyltransferase